jgi:hypothetical protein
VAAQVYAIVDIYTVSRVRYDRTVIPSHYDLLVVFVVAATIQVGGLIFLGWVAWKTPRQLAAMVAESRERPSSSAVAAGRWSRWTVHASGASRWTRRTADDPGRPLREVPARTPAVLWAVTEFLRRLGVDFRVLLDPNQEAPRARRVRVLPASFLIDAAGRVRFSVIGEVDWMGEEAVKRVGSLLP